jgi:hypothetical protein
VLCPVLTSSWLRIVPLLALPSCMVSFHDYPLGELDGESGGRAANAGKGGLGSAGDSVLPLGGSPSSGGSSSSGGGGATEGGTSEGGNAGATLFGSSSIDDFEDGDEQILPLEGRNGSWYIGNDGQGMQTPRSDSLVKPSLLEPPRTGSTRAAHTFGGPFQVWGALIGTSLGYADGKALPYDLSRYSGIRLWVRSGSTAPNAAKSVRLNLPMTGTNPGGGCTACSDHFGVDIPLTPQWEQVEVPFSSLKQMGFGAPKLPAPDLQHVVSLQLAFPKGVVFDLWIDDVDLY